MVPDLRSWVQFSPATQFSVAHIPPSLMSTRPTGMAMPEREQAAPIVVAHTWEGEYWTIA
jgi:hypothetical protein